MIFPSDYQQRILKEEKSRHYKAMLDDQIRQNNFYNQQKAIRRNPRIRTDPNQNFNYRPHPYTSEKELPHSSTFLPTISNNPIDHSFKYGGTPTNQQKRNASLIPSRKQSFQRQNEEDLDDKLQKCLEQCDQLINGINKNFINLNQHLRSNMLKRSHPQPKVQKQKYSSDLETIQHGGSRPIDNFPVTNLRNSQKMYQDDIGRDQMMNYNIRKAKQKFQYFSPEKKYHSPVSNRDGFDNSFDRSQPKTKRKPENNLFSSKVKLQKKKNHSSIDFDAINSDEQNQFDPQNSQDRYGNSNKNKKSNHNRNRTGDYNDSDKSGNFSKNHSASKGKSSKLSKQGGKDKTQESSNQMKKQQAILQQMKKKDSQIIEHLRKAKNRGNILFKKIEVFKKQRQELQRSSSNFEQNQFKNLDPKNDPSKPTSIKLIPTQNKPGQPDVKTNLQKQDISASPKKQQIKKDATIQNKAVLSSDKQPIAKVGQKIP